MTNISTFLFDIDGVVVAPHEPFATSYARRHKIAKKDIDNFFSNEFPRTLLGDKDLAELITEHKDAWKLTATSAQLLKDWFKAENVVDAELIEDILNLRSSGYKCYAATNQEKHRAEYLMESALRNVFDGWFFSCQLGAMKPSKDFFKKVLSEVADEAVNTLFIDDNAVNIQVAQEMGMQTYHYKDRQSFLTHLDTLKLMSRS